MRAPEDLVLLRLHVTALPRTRPPILVLLPPACGTFVPETPFAAKVGANRSPNSLSTASQGKTHLSIVICGHVDSGEHHR